MVSWDALRGEFRPLLKLVVADLLHVLTRCAIPEHSANCLQITT